MLFFRKTNDIALQRSYFYSVLPYAILRVVSVVHLVILVISLPCVVMSITCYDCNDYVNPGCKDTANLEAFECPSNITTCVEGIVNDRKTHQPSEYEM